MTVLHRLRGRPGSSFDRIMKHFLSKNLSPVTKVDPSDQNLPWQDGLSSFALPLVATASACLLVAAFLFPDHILRWGLIGIAVVAISIVVVLLSAKGYTPLSLAVALTGMWSVISFTVLTSGGVASAANTGYLILVLAAGLAMGGRAALLTAAMCSLTELGFVYIANHRLLPPLGVNPTLMSLWIRHLMYYSLVLLFPYLSTRNIRKALRKAEEEVESKKRAEGNLKESEARFRDLASAAFEGVMIHVSGKIVDANEAFAKLFGFESADELIGKDRWEILPLSKASLTLLKDYSAAGSTETVDIEIVRRDGSTMAAETCARTVVYRGNDARVVTVRDITGRREMEKALRKSEERYRTLYENFSLGIYRTTPGGKIVLSNPALVKMLGYSSFEELATRDLDAEGFEPSYDRKYFIQQIEANGEVNGLEAPWTRKDGTIVYVRESARALRDSDGNTLYYDGTVEDITERKQAEFALRESEEKFRVMFESSRDAITVSKQGTLIFANRAFLVLHGYEQIDEVVGTPVIDHIAPGNHQNTNEFMKEKTKAGEVPTFFEIRGRKKDGTEFDAEVNVSAYELHGEAYSLSIIRDITDKKKALEELQRSEERMRAIVEGTPHLFFYTQDAEAKNTYVSTTVENITGYDVDTWLKRRDWFVTDSPINRVAVERTQAHLRGEFNGGPAIIEVRHATGRPILLEVYENPITKDGKLIGVQGVAHDITEQRRANENLRESEMRFRQLSEASLEGIVITQDGIVIDANGRLAELLGYEVQEMIGRHGTDFIAPEFRAEVRKHIIEGFEGEYEHCLLRKDGSIVPVDSHARTEVRKGKIVRLTTILDLSKRKQAEAALKESELRYSELIESMPVGHYKSTSAGRFVEVNAAFCKMVGYSRQELLEMNIPETLYFHATERSGETLFTGFSPVTEIYRLKHKDGSSVWFEDFARYIRDDSGRIVYHEGICIDITEKKIAGEKEFRLSKESGTMNELSALLLGSEHSHARMLDLCVQRCAEIIGDGASIFLYRPGNSELELASVYYNDPEACKIFKEHFMAHPLRFDEGGYGEVISTKKAKIVRSIDVEMLTTEPVDAKREFLSKMPIYSAIYAPLRDKGDCIGVLGLGRHDPQKPKYTEHDLRFVQDVADRAAMALSAASINEALRKEVQERNLAEEQLRLQAVALNTAVNGIVITDIAGRIIWVNQAFETVTGYFLSEAIGKNLSELIKSDKQDRQFYKVLWDTILSGKVWQGEFVNKKKDGTLYSDYTTIAPVKGEDGTITHFVGIKQDITDRKSLQEQLLQSQKLESIGQLAGGVAHDYNNILGVVIGYAQLLNANLKGDHRIKKPVDSILNAANRGADLTRQLLAFARKEMISPKVININLAVDSIKKILGRLIGENIELEFRAVPQLWNIRIDPSQFDQIMVNLAANSRDAIKGVGTIRIEAANVCADESYVEKYAGMNIGNFVKLSFTDTGSGMQAETMKRIFEPFFTTKARGQGTGLGLSTVYGIVKQNYGHIHVKSVFGQGTTFKIFFPACYEAIETADEDQSEELLRGTETILIVEDQQDMLDLAKASLEKFGYHALTASNPRDAITICESGGDKIDVLLTDVIMPVMSGKALDDKVKSLRPKIKTLFMSGYTSDELSPEGVHHGQVHFIQKPFTPAGLAKKVRELLTK